MKAVEAPSYPVTIFIAGDAAEARRLCRAFCFRVGACVHVVDTDFIYTGGAEAGVSVDFINYPRFPSEPAAIFDRAVDLAHELIEGLHQHSESVQAPDRTVWLSRRPDNQ